MWSFEISRWLKCGALYCHGGSVTLDILPTSVTMELDLV